MVPLQEQSATNRNIRTTMPAPVKKSAKLEPRKTLVERAGGLTRPPASGTTLVRSKSTTSLSHARTKSATVSVARTGTSSRSVTSRTSMSARPASVNSTRPPSSAASRPGSASGHNDDTEGGPTKKVRRAAWDTKGRLEDMEEAYKELKDQFKTVKSTAVVEKDSISTELQDERRRVEELQLQKQTLQIQFDAANEHIGKLTGEMHIARMEREQLVHRQKMDIEDEKANSMRNEQQIRMLVADREREIENNKRDTEAKCRALQGDIESKCREIRLLQANVEDLELSAARDKKTIGALKDQLAEQCTGTMTLQQYVESLKGKLDQMETENKSLEHTITKREEALDISCREQEDLKLSLINEETLRRKLHNQIQELKGNIRVFCRVRPSLVHESAELKTIQLTDVPDELEVVGTGAEMSLTGREDKTYGFRFDKVRRCLEDDLT